MRQAGSGDFGLLYYLHQPTRLKIVKMSHAFIGLHTSFLIWLGLTQLTKLSLYIGHTDDSKGPALKRLISTEKQAALKLTTFTVAITQIASYKWFWDKLLLIMPYILCTHYKVTIPSSLRPAPTILLLCHYGMYLTSSYRNSIYYLISKWYRLLLTELPFVKSGPKTSIVSLFDIPSLIVHR